jgi:hypothetical protein
MGAVFILYVGSLNISNARYKPWHINVSQHIKIDPLIVHGRVYYCPCNYEYNQNLLRPQYYTEHSLTQNFNHDMCSNNIVILSSELHWIPVVFFKLLNIVIQSLV